MVNRFLRAHRAAAADPYGREVSPEHALVVRVGYGDGDHVADGRYAAAYELPRKAKGSRRREDLSPAERLAAIVGGRDEQLACEELVLRARADIDAGRPREAALQARVALEAALAELGGEGAGLAPIGGRWGGRQRRAGARPLTGSSGGRRRGGGADGVCAAAEATEAGLRCGAGAGCRVRLPALEAVPELDKPRPVLVRARQLRLGRGRALEQRYSVAEHHGHHEQHQLVHQAGL